MYEFLHYFIIISESFSLYYLILFYHALKKPLAPYKFLLSLINNLKTINEVFNNKNHPFFYILAKYYALYPQGRHCFHV